MFLKSSFKGVYRSPIRSILLVLILGITGFVWELGISTWADINFFLDRCNELYVTLGRVEFLGDNYDEEFIEGEDIKALIDFEKILALNDEDSVIIAERSQEYFGQVAGYERTDMYSMAQDEVVLVVTGAILIDEEEKIYQVRSKEVLYSDKDLFGKTILVSAGEWILETEKDYVIYAENKPITKVLYNVEPVNYVTPNGEEISAYYELGVGEEIPKEYYTIAESLKIKQNGVVITPTGNMESIFLFHQDQLFLEKGRAFSKDEYANGSSVCIINGIMAERLGVGIGDEIDLSWINDGTTDMWADYWPETGFSEREKFIVVGITNKLNDKNYYVYVPDSKMFHSNSIAGDHEILRVVLDNQKSSEYVDLINEELGDELKFSLYDQGYANTAGAYVSIQNIAILIVFSVSILCIASIFLIGYEAVYRRRDVAEVMMKLGCKRKQIIRYYSYGGMYLAISGILLGTIVSLFVRENVFAWVQEVSQSRTEIDLRFSDFSFAMQRKALEFEPLPGVVHFIWMSVVLLMVCFFVILFFSLNVSRIEKKGKNRIRRRNEVKIYMHRYGRSSPGYSIRHIVRSRLRTLGILFLGIAISFFGSVILDAYYNSSNNLEKLIKEEEIQGYCVNIRGEVDTSLILSTKELQSIYENNYFDQISASSNQKVIFWGRSKTKEGELLEIDPEPSLDTEASEILMSRSLMKGVNLYYTSNLDMSPRFIHQQEVETEFLEGFDEEFLGGEYISFDQIHAMVSFDLAKKEGIELGDYITVLYDTRDWSRGGYQSIEYQVVGFYQKNTDEEDMYVPLDYLTETSFMREEDLSDERFYAYYDNTECLNAISFRLKGLEHISEAKDSLEVAGYSEIGSVEKNRKYVLLEDGVPLSNLNNFIIQDQYTRILVILMIFLSGIANLLISSSLIRNRKNDIGIMMGMGATKWQVYKAFVTESILVYVFGNVVTIGIMNLFIFNLNNIHYYFFVGAAFCFLLGSTYALVRVSNNRLIENMKDVEE
jgi:ABC-type lipoprotein release transport system permease subunit